MNIQPIRDEKGYEAVLTEIEKLWGAKKGTAKSDKLEVLVVLVEAYEAEHHPIDPPDPIEAIKFRMDQMGLTRKDLEEYIGPKGRVSEILNRRRGLSLGMIRNLHSGLHIPLESLIRES